MNTIAKPKLEHYIGEELILSTVSGTIQCTSLFAIARKCPVEMGEVGI